MVVEAEVTPVATGGLNVLVVENHADTRRSVHVFLRALGHRATGAESIAEAISLAREVPFDLLLSDILLPDGDGWELLVQLEAEGCRPPHAIAMSGLGQPDDFARSRAAGFAKHLVKPFAPEDLALALGRVSRREAPQAGENLEPAPRHEAGPSAWLAQQIHDGLCQQLAAAALLQQALILRLEKVSPPPLAETVSDARYISRLLDDALTDTRTLMRELRGGA